MKLIFIFNFMIGNGGATYMLTNKTKTVIYIGATNDLHNRIAQHKQHYNKNSFTHRYNVVILVWYRLFHSVEESFAYEKKLKGLTRVKKLKLIHDINPDWNDLWEDIVKW